jgi:hypothetical protein
MSPWRHPAASFSLAPRIRTSGSATDLAAPPSRHTLFIRPAEVPRMLL